MGVNEKKLFDEKEKEEVLEKIETLVEKINLMNGEEKNKRIKNLYNKYRYQLFEIKKYLELEDEYREKEMKDFKESSKTFVVGFVFFLTIIAGYGAYVDAIVRDKDLAFVLTGVLSTFGLEALLLVGAHKKWGTKLYNHLLDSKKSGKYNQVEKIERKIEEQKDKIFCAR